MGGKERDLDLPLRILVTFLISAFTMGLFCQTTSPGAIQHDLTLVMNLTNGQYSALYSVASWSSLFDIVNGYVIEKWVGLKIATYTYSVIIIIGNALYILSGYLELFWLMVLGRFLFGLGGNPTYLCMSCFIIHWFDGKGMNLMFAQMEGVIWLGSSISFFTALRIKNYVGSHPGIDESKLIATTISVVTVIMTVIMVVSSCIIAFMYKKQKPTVKNDADSSLEGRIEEKTPIEEKNPNLSLHFRPLFWIFLLSIFLYYIGIISFIAMSQEFFKYKYNVSIETANDMSSLFTLIAFLLSPPFGYAIDLCGRNLLFYTAVVLFGLAAHLIFGFTSITPLIPVVLLGISAALSSSAWAMFKFIVDSNQYAMAYGIAQTGAQFAIAVGSMGAGYLVDVYGYAYLEYFYSALLAGSFATVPILWYLDFNMGRPISMSASERTMRLEDNKECSSMTESSLDPASFTSLDKMK